ncbi:YozQ family protein [Siminovitchia sp. 179-K 8D1 HS]|uniref:YozQ family protein n=1 Tax=Siminovitchia sp. 179-K 8D1 HS TaxID=3142385 RepID=UPI00399F05DB
MDKKNPDDSLRLAGRQYRNEDYQGRDRLSKGLAIIHEQISDVYMEGTIDGVMDDVDGENIDLSPKKGGESIDRQ